MSKARELADVIGTQDTTENVLQGRRNLIINGAMQVAQRGTSVTGITSSSFNTTDRFKDGVSQGTWTSERSTDAPSGFAYSHKLSCTTSATLHSGAINIHQRIEGYNVSHLNYGSSDAKSLTASFWVKSNKTGTFQAELYNLTSSSNHYGMTYTIDAADTWEKKTFNISANTAYTLLSGNQGALLFLMWFDADSSLTSGTYTDSTWVNHSNPNRVTSSITGIGGSTSDYVAVTGVQLEVGSTATPFEHRSYGEELALCQRYYYETDYNARMSVDAKNTYLTSNWFGFPVFMRATPTISLSFPWTGSNFNSGSLSKTTETGISVGITGNGNTAGYAACDVAFTADAEL